MKLAWYASCRSQYIDAPTSSLCLVLYQKFWVQYAELYSLHAPQWRRRVWELVHLAELRLPGLALDVYHVSLPPCAGVPCSETPTGTDVGWSKGMWQRKGTQATSDQSP